MSDFAAAAEVRWEAGEPDPAEELARLVLEHAGRPLPAVAARLARRVLRSRRARLAGLADELHDEPEFALT